MHEVGLIIIIIIIIIKKSYIAQMAAQHTYYYSVYERVQPSELTNTLCLVA